MLIIANDNTGTITLADLDVLDCVLIQSGLIGLLKHGNHTRRINDLLELCDPAIKMVLDLLADGTFDPDKIEFDDEIEIELDYPDFLDAGFVEPEGADDEQFEDGD